MNTSASSVQRPANPVPTQNPLQGGSRRYVLSDVLFTNVKGAGTYATTSTDFEIWHPSVRLHCAVTLGFLGDTQEDATLPAGFVAIMSAWAKTEAQRFGGRRVRGNSIIPGPFSLPTALPWSYESITGIDQWRGTASVPAGGTGLAVSGQLIITATWEPAAGDNISDDDLERLFRTCKLQGGSGATVYQTAGG